LEQKFDRSAISLAISVRAISTLSNQIWFFDVNSKNMFQGFHVKAVITPALLNFKKHEPKPLYKPVFKKTGEYSLLGKGFNTFDF